MLLPGTPYWEAGPKPPESMKDATPEQKDQIFEGSVAALGWPQVPCRNFITDFRIGLD